MDLGLRGKIAIVTGGSLGIGRATALALAREGVQVVTCARGLDALHQAADEIRTATGSSVLPLRADMNSLEDIQRPEDIADLVLFLVSARASAMTGQVIAVDGGAGRGIFY
jgi:NAD(P)-dependent dehydrogenase (short-subunit alcohol dehydrogenase family)